MIYYLSTKILIFSKTVYEKLFKIHITLILSILSVYFCRLLSHVATATLLHR